jgi:hypothetical protein
MMKIESHQEVMSVSVKRENEEQATASRASEFEVVRVSNSWDFAINLSAPAREKKQL